MPAGRHGGLIGAASAHPYLVAISKYPAPDGALALFRWPFPCGFPHHAALSQCLLTRYSVHYVKSYSARKPEELAKVFSLLLCRAMSALYHAEGCLRRGLMGHPGALLLQSRGMV